MGKYYKIIFKRNLWNLETWYEAQKPVQTLLHTHKARLFTDEEEKAKDNMAKDGGGRKDTCKMEIVEWEPQRMAEKAGERVWVPYVPRGTKWIGEGEGYIIMTSYLVSEEKGSCQPHSRL